MTLSLQVFVTTESSLCMFSHDLTLSSTVEALNLKESPAMCSGGGGERWYPDMVVIRSSYHVYTSPTIVSRTKKNIFRSSGYRAGKTQGICVCHMHMICSQSPSYHQQEEILFLSLKCQPAGNMKWGIYTHYSYQAPCTVPNKF